MKQCPQCSTDYRDEVGFCPSDGRSLVGVSAAAGRLCPHCANSISEDAAQCPYCKADLGAAPEWLIRDESPSAARSLVRETGAPKIVLFAGILLCIIAAVLFAAGIFGNLESSASHGQLAQKSQELLIKEEQIKAMEAELNKMRLDTADLTKELVTLKARLEERDKELTTTEQQLAVARRGLESGNTRRTQVEPRSDPRPVPVERASTPVRPTERQIQPRVYETVRVTEVREQPLQSSRVITQISGGTRINVVRSDGDWLEIISKRGNPPGFILREHARLAGTVN